MAAAAVVVVGIAVGAVVAARSNAPGQDLAAAALSGAGLERGAEGATGSATLVRRGDDTYLELRLVDPPAPTSGYLEVWLLDRQTRGMVSLGPFRGVGRYLVPSGIDPAAFPVVDVSDEPPDGDPTHSGVSLLRGELA